MTNHALVSDTFVWKKTTTFPLQQFSYSDLWLPSIGCGISFLNNGFLHQCLSPEVARQSPKQKDSREIKAETNNEQI